MKILGITQARVGSSRLPGKVLKTISGETLLEIHIQRALRSKKITDFLIATSTEAADSSIVELCKGVGVNCFRGSENDVLERFYQAAIPYQPDYVVRLTADCPLIDGGIIDQVINGCIDQGLDYMSNTLTPTFPDGEDVEVFTFAALEKAFREAALPSEREHVTSYIHKNRTLFKCANLAIDGSYGDIRLTVDHMADYEVIKKLIDALGTDKGWKEYADRYLADPRIAGINSDIERNEGYYNSLKKD